MKTLITLLLLVNTGLIMAAAPSHDCTMGLPAGEGKLLITQKVIELDFLNHSLGKVFEGRFSISFINDKTGHFVATGSFKDGSEFIVTTLQGRIAQDDTGRINFSMNSLRDQRIEFGYGNFVACMPI